MTDGPLILVADDHDLIREGLRNYLAVLNPPPFVEEAGSLASALNVLSGLAREPDLVLLDLKLPDTSGLDGAVRIHTAAPKARLAIISAYFDPDIVSRAFEVGAAGFLPKSLNREAFLSAVRLILAGEIYVPSELLFSAADPAASRPHLGVNGAACLTASESQILTLVARGFTNKEIARDLGLEEGSIKVYLSRVFKKIGVRNRTEAALYVAARRP